MFVPGPKSCLEWLHWGSWAWQENFGLFKAADLCSSQELAGVCTNSSHEIISKKHSVSLGGCLQNISAALEAGFICTERLQCQKAKQWQQGWKEAATSASWNLILGLGTLMENRGAGMNFSTSILNVNNQAAAWGEKGLWVTIQKGQSKDGEENSKVGLFLTDFWEFSCF